LHEESYHGEYFLDPEPIHMLKLFLWWRN